MLKNFVSFIQNRQLCTNFNTILLAVSGGVDSVVMLDLFYRAGYKCLIAHCNFRLRGEESDKDQEFVKDLAASYDFPFYNRSFDTEEHARSQSISVQMAARELRYEWFEDLRFQTSADYIATAHNKNDVLETCFINLSRGTGIRGLTGIKEKSGNVIRPLLFASRTDILEYAERMDVEWREDSSNQSLKYSRNKVRHQIIPVFKELNPAFEDIMMNNIQRLRATEEIFLEHLEDKKKELLIRDRNLIKIPVDKLRNTARAETWLYEILTDYNFSFPVVKNIMKSLEGISGKIFYSSSHRLVKDRDELIIELLKDEQSRRYYIEDPLDKIEEPLDLDMEILEKTPELVIPPDKDTAFLDLDKLEFPLILRKWEKGDYFRPLGMKNMKKLSDFFIDNKLSITRKEQLWLLTSGKNIIWIPGMRIDDRYKITGQTHRILKIRNLT